MRVTNATNDTYATLTASGTVVVAFYMSSTCGGYKDTEPKSATCGARPRRPRHYADIRKALASAAWQKSRGIKVVFVECEQCEATCHRLGILAFPEFLILKEGVRVAQMGGMVQGGHRDSYRLARERFVEWLSQHLPSPP